MSEMAPWGAAAGGPCMAAALEAERLTPATSATGAVGAVLVESNGLVGGPSWRPFTVWYRLRLT